MAAISENTPRLSFNPSWMGSTYASTVPNSVSRSVSVDDSGPDTGGQGKNYPLAPPKLANNRYGREEMLALFQPDYDWGSLHVLQDRFPDFYMEECGQPITVTPFTEIEERYIQQGINSSKAMSAVTHAERAPGGGTGFHNTRWQPEERTGFETGAPAGRGSGFSGRGRGGYSGSSSFPHRGRGGGMAGLGGPGSGGGTGTGSAENGRFGSASGSNFSRFLDHTLASAVGRGRGAGPPASPGARGGASLPVMNPRAQGLYDPRDPRDRPRQRLRSTGEGAAPGGTYTAPGARTWNRGDDVPEWAAGDDEEEDSGWSFGEDGQFRKDKLPSEDPPLRGSNSISDRSRNLDKSDTNGERKSSSKERERAKPKAMTPEDPPRQDSKENSWGINDHPQSRSSGFVENRREGTPEAMNNQQKSLSTTPGVSQHSSHLQQSSQKSDGIPSLSQQSSMVPGGNRGGAFPLGGDNRTRLSDLLKGTATTAPATSNAYDPMMSNLSASLGSQSSSQSKPRNAPEQVFEKIHSDVESLVNSFGESDSEATALRKLAGLGISQATPHSKSSFYEQQASSVGGATGGAGLGLSITETTKLSTGPQTHPSATSQTSSSSSPNPWYYLDPRNQIQGPFNASQMTAWFQAGYFDMGLKVRRHSDRDFVLLAELIKVYGGIPFSMEIGAGAPGPAAAVSKAHTPSPQQMLPSQPQSQSPFSASTAQLTSAKSKAASAQHGVSQPQSVWGDVEPLSGPNEAQIALEKLAQIQKQQMQEKQRLESEQRRIQELEAQFKKEKEEREKKEREFLEQQQELKRIQEELQKQRQKEEMEKKRAEDEKRQREAIKLEQKRREEAAAQQEALERERKARDEIARKLREEQQRINEKEQKIRQEEAEKAAAAQAEALRRAEKAAAVQAEAMRKAEMERRITEEKERKQREQQEISAGQRISINDLLRLSGQVASAGTWGGFPNENQPPATGGLADQSGSAWSRPTASAGAPVAAPTAPGAKSLLEIQREEERQVKAEMRQMAEMEKERKAALNTMNMGNDSVWGSSSKPLRWNPPASGGPSPAWGGAGVPAASQGFWDTDPSPIARPTPQDNRSKATKKQTSQSNSSHKGGNPQNQQQTKGKAKKKNNPLGGSGTTEDPFVQWMVKEIESLNSDVDAPTFANFILAVESPNEVEEFVTGYFGDSKPAKEFLQNFLRKRSEQRNSRKKTSDRDDLSAPAAALGTAGGAAANTGTVAGAGKKKKKGQRKVVDSRVLGFTAAADSTRLNIGEIEVPE